MNGFEQHNSQKTRTQLQAPELLLQSMASTATQFVSRLTSCWLSCDCRLGWLTKQNMNASVYLVYRETGSQTQKKFFFFPS